MDRATAWPKDQAAPGRLAFRKFASRNDCGEFQQSQQELARAMKVNQPAVAKLEKRADTYVSNLRRYIEALGGSLEITARFPNGAVNITNFSDLGTRRESN